MITDLMVNTDMCCCGVNELSGIIHEDPFDILCDVGVQRFDEGKECAFYIFTDIDTQKYGAALAKYITDNELGQIAASKSKINPNSDNRLRVWVWSVSDRAFHRWWRKNRDNSITYYGDTDG